MRIDSEIGMPVFMSDDAKEGPPAFMEKRTPEFTGRVGGPWSSPTSTCSTATGSPRASRTSGSPTCAPTTRCTTTPSPTGPGFWVITKHADVITCNRDAGTFSSEQERGGVVGLEEGGLGSETDEERAARESRRPHDADDGPARPHPLPQAGEPGLHAADDRPARAPHPRADRRASSTRRVAKGDESTSSSTSPPSSRSRSSPSSSACPSEDRHKIFDWSNRMIGSEDPEYMVSAEEVVQRPGRDVHVRPAAGREAPGRARATTSSPRSSAAEVDGESLSDMDFNLFFLLLSVAGNETTRNAISHGMNAFLENPDQYDLLVERPRRAHRRARSRRSCGGRRRSCTSGATPPRTSSSGARRSRPATRSASGTSRPTGTRTCSTTRSGSTSPATRTTTSPSVAAVPTSASGAQLARMEIQLLFEELAKRVPALEALGAARPPALATSSAASSTSRWPCHAS